MQTVHKKTLILLRAQNTNDCHVNSLQQIVNHVNNSQQNGNSLNSSQQNVNHVNC